MAPNVPANLIDMHCHVFNASDLPASQFIYRVIRQRYNADPDALVPLLGMIMTAIAGNAPTPGEELTDIERDQETKTAAVTKGAAGNADILSWLKLFGRSRRDLIAALTGFYTATNNKCELIAPALVDYNAWLDNPDVAGQLLPDQVAVMGAIAKVPGTPRVHGFVGYDPVRAILAELGYHPGGAYLDNPYKPLDLVRDAVTKHGFLGVKLYPPMGFRAWNNGAGDITFSATVRKYINLAFDNLSDKELGKRIDAQLKKLYRFCADEGVPILAHAYNSNQADECNGWRASPQYWGKVIEEFSTPEKPLRLCLGHFGSFKAHTQFPACHDAFTAKAWEIIIGGIISDPKGKYVFADLSYLSEVLDRHDGWQARRKAMSDQFKSFVSHYDANTEHLCYGSDWIMLGLENGHERYHVALGDFLRNDAGLSDNQLENVYFRNAVRFLGLRPQDQNRARLDKFYTDNGIGDFFPKIDPLVG